MLSAFAGIITVADMNTSVIVYKRIENVTVIIQNEKILIYDRLWIIMWWIFGGIDVWYPVIIHWTIISINI